LDLALGMVLVVTLLAVIAAGNARAADDYCVEATGETGSGAERTFGMATTGPYVTKSPSARVSGELRVVQRQADFRARGAGREARTPGSPSCPSSSRRWRSSGRSSSAGRSRTEPKPSLPRRPRSETTRSAS
jgi:hypothetical protein